MHRSECANARMHQCTNAENTSLLHPAFLHSCISCLRATLSGSCFGLRSGSRVRKLLGPRVVAVVVVAENLPAVLLGGLLEEERRTALRARLVDRAVPQHEVAVRVVGAPEEDLPALGFALDDLAALVGVLRTLHARSLVLDVLALGILRAGGELAEAALLDHEICAAARARLVQDLIGFGGPQPALLGGDQLPRRLALGIAGARQELAEAA